MLQTPLWNKVRYTLISPVYNFFGKGLNPLRKKGIESLKVSDEDKVLVVGGGTGLDLKFLPKNTAGTVIDISPSLVKKMKARFGTAYPNLSFQMANAHKLPFSEDSFSAVVVHLVLAVDDNPLSIIQEIKRVASFGAKISVLDIFCHPKLSPNNLHRGIDFIFRLLLSSALLNYSKVTQGFEGRVTQEKFGKRGKWYRQVTIELS